MRYESILFDLDGTLLNTNELILHTFNYTLQEILGITVPKEQIYATFGRPLREIMVEFDAERADLLLTTYRAYNAQIHDEYVTLFDQVEETLAKLKDLGLKLSVVTSKKAISLVTGWRISIWSIISTLLSALRIHLDTSPIQRRLKRR